MIYECHGHIILDGVSYKDSVARHKNGVDESFVRQNLALCAAHGITFYRDGGDKHNVGVLARKVAQEYGIDYRTPAYIIHKKGGYGNMFGRAFENMREYRELIDEAGRLGADFIKLTASGIVDYKDGNITGPPIDDEFPEMVKIAHGEGYAVMVHANGTDNIKRAAAAGADSIEHGFGIGRDALLTMAHTGTIWVPTCATAVNLIGCGRYDDAIIRKIAGDHKAAIASGRDMGVTIACGSDAGASHVGQGTGAHDELAILTALGIDPADGNRKLSEVFKQ